MLILTKIWCEQPPKCAESENEHHLIFSSRFLNKYQCKLKTPKKVVFLPQLFQKWSNNLKSATVFFQSVLLIFSAIFDHRFSSEGIEVN